MLLLVDLSLFVGKLGEGLSSGSDGKIQWAQSGEMFEGQQQQQQQKPLLWRSQTFRETPREFRTPRPTRLQVDRELPKRTLSPPGTGAARLVAR